MIKRSTVLYKKKRLPWRDFDGEVVIVDTQTLACLNLNEAASLIWRLIDGSNTCHDIIQQITGAFEVSEVEAQRDFFAYAHTLLSKGFIVDAVPSSNDR